MGNWFKKAVGKTLGTLGWDTGGSLEEARQNDAELVAALENRPTVSTPVLNTRRVPDTYSSAPTQMDPDSIAAMDAAEKASAEEADKKKWDDLIAPIDAALAQSGQLAGNYTQNASGAIEKAYNASMDNASRSQAKLARRNVEAAARMGGSAGGGMQQAGGAQAALYGQELQNNAGIALSGQELDMYREGISLEKAALDHQLDFAKELYRNARTDEEREEAYTFQKQVTQMQNDWDLLMTEIAAGGVENIDEVIKARFPELKR